MEHFFISLDRGFSILFLWYHLLQFNQFNFSLLIIHRLYWFIFLQCTYISNPAVDSFCVIIFNTFNRLKKNHFLKQNKKHKINFIELNIIFYLNIHITNEFCHFCQLIVLNNRFAKIKFRKKRWYKYRWLNRIGACLFRQCPKKQIQHVRITLIRRWLVHNSQTKVIIFVIGSWYFEKGVYVANTRYVVGYEWTELEIELDVLGLIAFDKLKDIFYFGRDRKVTINGRIISPFIF